MLRMFRLLLLVALLAVVLVFAPLPRPAAAGGGCIVFNSSSAGTVTLIAGHTYSMSFNGIPVITWVAGVTGPVGVYAPPAAPGLTVVIIDQSESCNSGDWWQPGDSRVNPQPNDRVSVYCNVNAAGALANTIAVFGILDDGQGKPLALFNYADIVKAGGKGITRSVEPLGTVYISVGSDKTSFYVKWMGGPADATGTGDFRKRFTCSFNQ